MVIWCLEPFKPVILDAFPYRRRYHTRSRSKVQKPKKKVFGFFHSLPFSLLLPLKSSTEGIKWRRYERFWATWGPCVMTSYDIDHGLPKSCLGPYFMFLTFLMEYLTYNGQTAKSTWREKSEKMAKKRAGNYFGHPGTPLFFTNLKTNRFLMIFNKSL